jgi:hypothetical protein
MKKGKGKRKGTFAVSRCNKCRKKQPVIITDFVNKAKEKKFTSVHCAVCETVLNVSKDIDIEYVAEAWLIKRGWEKVTPTGAHRG